MGTNSISCSLLYIRRSPFQSQKNIRKSDVSKSTLIFKQLFRTKALKKVYLQSHETDALEQSPLFPSPEKEYQMFVETVLMQNQNTNEIFKVHISL